MQEVKVQRKATVFKAYDFEHPKAPVDIDIDDDINAIVRVTRELVNEGFIHLVEKPCWTDEEIKGWGGKQKSARYWKYLSAQMSLDLRG